jgi:hypothetical protein
MNKWTISNLILVTGAHRSGTSALTRTLNIAGATLPRQLLDPVIGVNDRGFWESSVFTSIHDHILNVAGTSWHNVTGIEEDWHSSKDSAFFEDRLFDAFTMEYGRGDLLLLKDPRICLLIPLWKKAAVKLNLLPKFVIPLRHPIEVAMSLEKRDGIPHIHGLALWLRYNLIAELETRNSTRVIVNYEDLLSDWKNVLTHIGQKLEINWPLDLDEVSIEINSFLSEDLRHYRQSDIGLHTIVHQLVSRAYSAFILLAHGDHSAYSELDAVRIEFDSLGFLLKQINLSSDNLAYNIERQRNFVLVSELNRIKQSRLWRIHSRLSRLIGLELQITNIDSLKRHI